MSSSTACCDRLAGSIKSLPKKNIIQHQIPPSLEIQDGIFGHPVIVLSGSALSGRVAVLVVTSFGGTPIKYRHADPQRRRRYLPIHPAEHPDSNETLMVAHNNTMDKASYACMDIHWVPLAILRDWRRESHLHLVEDSYKILLRIVWSQGLDILAASISTSPSTPTRQSQRLTEATAAVPPQTPTERGLVWQLLEHRPAVSPARPSREPYGTFHQNRVVSTIPSSNLHAARTNVGIIRTRPTAEYARHEVGVVEQPQQTGAGIFIFILFLVCLYVVWVLGDTGKLGTL
ncbi:hypothetical protein B0I35DRAFT_439444 [Stachybotrys elegans]|uniref:Uncharacterized protein n=1 Tax=Stachybotrys elegans TaxID=80388 RepID=A0A8K0SF78_9HYPO|nr:hypothetical protein B0I35DRAFT_439444 [Stachybotrys elegans]